jgi:hypothetical protein
MKDKILAKFDELFAARNKYAADKDLAAEYTLEKHDLNGKSHAAQETLTEFFAMFTSAIPEDKKEELHKAFENIYGKILGKKRLDFVRENSLKNPSYTTPEQKKCFLFQSCPDDAFREGAVREFIENYASALGDETLEKIINDIDAYQPEILYNHKVYPLRGRVEDLKEKNKERVNDPAKLRALNDELDSIANLVVTSTPKYSDFNGDTFDGVARKKLYMRIDATNDKQLAQDEYKHLADYFVESQAGGFDGERDINSKHETDTNIANVFMDDKLKLIVNEDRQKSFMKIINYMNEKNMLYTDVSAGESGDKIYGFRQIYNAHQRLVKIIETDDLDAIREAKESYQTALENMRGLYKLIREELNPTNDMMLGNITSYRETWLPNEFKNDILCNVFVNGFFNLNVNLVNNGISYDEFFENPGKASLRMIKNYTKPFAPDNILNHDDLADAIKTMAEGFSGYFVTYGIGRNFEFTYALTYGTPEYEKNTLSTMLISSYASHVIRSLNFEKSCTMKTYLKNNAEETLANVFLVNPEDRDYGKLRADDTISLDFTEKAPPFDSLGYLASHNVEPSQLTARINKTIADLSKMEVKNGGLSTKDMMLMAIKGAQIAAHEYLMVHPTPSAGFMTKSEYKALKMIAENPEKAFGKSLGKELINELRKAQPIKEYQKALEGVGKSARAEARNAEEAYQKRMDDIKNEIKTLTGNMFGADEKTTNELNEKFRKLEEELRALPAEEIKKLDKAYTDGKLPKSYYEQRKLDIQNGTHNNKVPFGTDEYPDFNQFKEKYKTELEDKELTNDDVKMFYERMMENARFEENKFLLCAAGKGPKPTLAEEEKAAPEKEHVVVLAAMDNSTTEVSKPIVPGAPHLENAKHI